MAVGMGIHGEPGIAEADLPRADELAEMLVSHLLSELPPDIDGQSAVVLLNGLGSVKYEELFVLYRHVDDLLAQAGVRIVEPEVGELVTSLDMAGVSLTISWLTPELADLWHAPANAAGYKKEVFSGEYRSAPQTLRAARRTFGEPRIADTAEDIPRASSGSRAAAGVVAVALDVVKGAIEANVAELGRLDAVAGDGDHGDAMLRGASAAARAAAAALAEEAGAGTVLKRAADEWADASGGASGALWGVGLRALGQVIGDAGRPDAGTVAAAVEHWSAEVMRVGGAVPGDKTLVDVLVPFAATLRARVDAGLSVGEAWTEAVSAAEDAAKATADLAPRVGRARPLAARSVGHPDAGATSLALVLRAVEPVIRGACA